MRYERTELPRTGITSLAATTGIVVFVAWLVCLAIQHGGLVAHDLTVSAPVAPAAHQAQVEGPPDPD
jgi:hypothetical protein